LECCTDSISLDALHRKVANYRSLKQFFVQQFGPPSGRAFKRARAKFVESLAAYSIVSYLLQFKDR
jgi:phosphatidylinositol 4-kinase